MSDKEIVAAIHKYAVAYAELQNLQDTVDSIPKGDQKTGCIGEYYVYRYLQHALPNVVLASGSHSEKGWDIAVRRQGAVVKVQVKTVSAFSSTRTISPIHKGWDQLFLLYLDRDLAPEGFWVIKDQSIFRNQDCLKSKRCPNPNKPRTGSSGIPFGPNRVEEMKAALST